MTDPDRRNGLPKEVPPTSVRCPDTQALGEITRSLEPEDVKNADVYLEGVESDKLAENPAALRQQVLGEAGQRSGSRLDADRGYGAGHAARDARSVGSALDEDGESA